MNRKKICLVLSDSKDFTTDYITIELEKRGVKYVRINRDMLSLSNISLDLQKEKLYFENSNIKAELDSNDIWAIYYRAPTYLRETFSRANTVEKQLEQSQWMSFYRNLEYFSSAKWLNRPSSTFLAENKVVQLQYAKNTGFVIPQTFVANCSSQISFYNDNLIVKSLDTAIFNYGDKEAFVYTNSISTSELNNSNIQLAPIIIQEDLNPKIDYRVTVVGDVVFCVKITKNNEGVLGDWRKQKDFVNFDRVELPVSIKNYCISLVSKFNLGFGAIDLILHNDKYYFIELNPTGEWAWLVDAANMKIYEEICNYLIG